MKEMSSILGKKPILSSRYSLLAGRIALFALIAVIGPQCAGSSGSTLQGQDAPAFSLKLLDGSTFDLAEHLGNRPVVLDFWAVWCPPCREAMPKVAAAVRDYQDKDVVILTVNQGDDPENIRSFLNDRSLDVPVALDDRGAVGRSYGVRSIPTMVFINREGKVARVVVGAMSESRLKSAINDLL